MLCKECVYLIFIILILTSESEAQYNKVFNELFQTWELIADTGMGCQTWVYF